MTEKRKNEISGKLGLEPGKGGNVGNWHHRQLFSSGILQIRDWSITSVAHLWKINTQAAVRYNVYSIKTLVASNYEKTVFPENITLALVLVDPARTTWHCN